MRRNANLMKEINLNLLRKVMKRRKKASKPQLAELTGLSVVTVQSLVKVLLERGEIFEDEIIPSSGGRPAATYRFNGEYRLALVIYMHEKIGRDVIFVEVDNLFGESLEKAEIVLPEISMADFDEIIERYIAQYPEIQVIAFGLPGTEVNGKLMMMDYKRLEGQAFTAHFQERFHLPVVFENDINAAVAGYCYIHEAQGEECVVGIYFPCKYPPGTGIFLNGSLYKGRDGFAGEIEYLPIGVDWKRFDHQAPDRHEMISKLILAITSLYNPDRVVLYGECLSDAIVEEVLLTCKRSIKEMLLPKMVVSRKFNEDFATGVQRIALNILEPVIAIEK